ncbi:ATP-binding protein [Amycolatopsis thailandensis]|uniref:DNA topoisomerase (ATP-hydrolyzing) n=1 Tax=Amycolatopsis thailandensis TaxID=589330 RepID=A0A229SDY6_9PSEU|nr:ATP-binding protein [Amycolatopsis thailandensis]OXM57118.1 ATP-binding protein [Amycolatopsis thailandensis]
MSDTSARRGDTTHDWAGSVDHDHLARIRRKPGEFSPGGVGHLVLEVLAYAAEEAESTGGGHAVVTVHPDGSVSVADNGRGTATRADGSGGFVKKPVMSTKDLRFFGFPDAQTLPDGHPRHGMSVVAALSDWLVHTNRRHNGSWTQRYERGVPVTDLTPIADDGTTGTTVRFRPGEDVGPVRLPEVGGWQYLSVEIVG